MSTDTIEQSFEQIINDHANEVAARIDTAEADLVVTRNGYERWAVIDTLGRYRENGSTPIPQVPASGFTTEDAANLARQQLVKCVADAMAWDPVLGSEDMNDEMVRHFNRLGTFMSVMRSQGVPETDLEERAEDLRRAVFPEPGDALLGDLPLGVH
jgi:hypothetical protein